MPGLRLLLTGPPRKSLREEAIRRAIAWADSTRGRTPMLWVAPSPLARDQIARDLALIPRRAGVPVPRVWCWEEIWADVPVEEATPARLSPAGVRAVLGEAIQRARETDVLGPLTSAVDQPGWQRRTLAQFAAWMRTERRPDGPPPGRSRAEVAHWSLFNHFCETLGDINARTPEGWASWSSHRLLEQPTPGGRDLSQSLIVVVEPVAPSRAARRVLDFWNAQAGRMIVTLPFESEPALSEVYAAVEPTRRYLLDQGFMVEEVGDSPGVTTLDRELFRADSHRRPRLAGAGMQILGGPQGEGQALLIARRVREALRAGTGPDEILVLVPREDDDAALMRAVLSSWRIPVAGVAARRLAMLPAVAALRLVLRLSVTDWEVATLTRLLRHNAIDWARLDLGDPFRRFEVAAAIAETKIYRNRVRLRKALDRSVAAPRSKLRAETDKSACQVIDRIAADLDRLVRQAPWRTHADRLRELAARLGLDAGELAPLWDAIEDHAWVQDQLGPAIAAIPLPGTAFVAAVERIITEAEPIRGSVADEAGAVRVAVVGTVDGARAALVILANLTERTFPTPDSVPLDPARAGSEPSVLADPAARSEDPIIPESIDAEPMVERHSDLSYARELLRFTRAVAAADGALTLTYPTTDPSGEALLPAGFLDEVLRRLDPAAGIVEAHARFDPVLRGHEVLAEASGDARALAVAQACAGQTAALRSLAAHPAHAGPLRGVAEAFRVGHLRRERASFNAHDGWLMDSTAVARVAESFGPDHPFSPSQLESYAFCPFQFFQRYVLKLKPSDGFEELAEDYAGRGKDVHHVLETVHRAIEAEGSGDLATHLPIHIAATMRVALDSFDRDDPPGEADVAEVLREIETRRTGKALDRYAAQFRAYNAKAGAGAVPHKFEVTFGQPDKAGSLDHLILGDGVERIKVQGVIDRIDLVPVGGETRFRVIDYKTGSNPSHADVKSGLASQLPLYTMAVEELVLPPGTVPFLDAGYWSLPKDGFRGVKLDDWEEYRAGMIDYVLAMVRELRRGVFPIASQEPKCTQFCDFHKTCRVGEVRSARKFWDDRPILEASSS